MVEAMAWSRDKKSGTHSEHRRGGRDHEAPQEACQWDFLVRRPHMAGYFLKMKNFRHAKFTSTFGRTNPANAHHTGQPSLAVMK
jgi:hypothetical protein